MNAISAKLLQDAIEGTANQFQRDREFTATKENQARDQDLRRQMLEQEIQRGKTAEAHYQDENNRGMKKDIRETERNRANEKLRTTTEARKATEDAAKTAKEDYKAFEASQKDFMRIIGQQVVANKKDPKMGYSNDEARSRFLNHIQDLVEKDPAKIDKFLQNNDIKPMLDPKFDFSSAANIPDGPTTQTFTDPVTGKQVGGIVNGKNPVKLMVPPAPPKPVSLGSTNVRQVPNPTAGEPPISLTNTVTKNFSTPALPAPAPLPVSPATPDAAPAGNIPIIIPDKSGVKWVYHGPHTNDLESAKSDRANWKRLQ